MYVCVGLSMCVCVFVFMHLCVCVCDHGKYRSSGLIIQLEIAQQVVYVMQVQKATFF